MTPELEERLVSAFESIATQLSGIARTLELDYQRRFPPKRPVEEPTITHVKNKEDKIREDFGESAEPIDRWTSLGPRESVIAGTEDEGKNGTS